MTLHRWRIQAMTSLTLADVSTAADDGKFEAE